MILILKHTRTFCFLDNLCPSIATGDAITEQQNSSMCVTTFEHDPFRVINQTCPPNQFCYAHPRSYTPEKNTYEGHCCPKPPSDLGVSLTCPLTPILNATCLDMARYGGGAPIPKELFPLCPIPSHECIEQPYRYENAMTFNLCITYCICCNLPRTEKICCPNPCTGSNTHINILGRCYELVYFEQECINSAQCPEKTICRSNASG